MDKREQCFPAAQYGQDFIVGIEAQTIITAGNPFGAGLAQFGQAYGQRIFFQFVQGGGQRVGDDFGIQHIGTQAFNRVKIGIGRPKNGMSVVNHVLSKFDKDDYIGILQSIDKVDDAVNHYLQEKNFEKTMQRYNG